MNSFMIVIAIIILVLEIVIILVARPYKFVPSKCGAQRTFRDGECYFDNSFEAGAEDYFVSRDKFIKLAKAMPNMEHYSLPIYNTLTTDVAIKKGTSDTVLLHISGTHGPEGFAGSSIQRSYLYSGHRRSHKRGKAATATQIYVHALNPYGFAFNRRVNEDNIDLINSVYNFSSEPNWFSRDCPLTNANKPIWGSCPGKTYVPDDNFEQLLINVKFESNYNFIFK